MKIRGAFACIIAAVLLVCAGCQTYQYDNSNASVTAVGLNPDTPGIQDVMFVREAFALSAREMELSRLSLARAQSLDLKLLAQRILDDNARADQDLRMIVRQQEVPSRVSIIETLEPYRNLVGANFDRAYVQHLVKVQREDIPKFRAAARTARNSDVRDFASRNLPVLEEHLRIAENIGRIAGLSADINEPAGAERPHRDPYYEGDPQLRHQFNTLILPGAQAQ